MSKSPKRKPKAKVIILPGRGAAPEDAPALFVDPPQDRPAGAFGPLTGAGLSVLYDVLQRVASEGRGPWVNELWADAQRAAVQAGIACAVHPQHRVDGAVAGASMRSPYTGELWPVRPGTCVKCAAADAVGIGRCGHPVARRLGHPDPERCVRCELSGSCSALAAGTASEDEQRSVAQLLTALLDRQGAELGEDLRGQSPGNPQAIEVARG